MAGLCLVGSVLSLGAGVATARLRACASAASEWMGGSLLASGLMLLGAGLQVALH